MQIAAENTRSKPASLSQKYKKSRNVAPRWINEFLFKSWWVIFFSMICYYAYATALDRREIEKITLQKKAEELNKEKAEALNLREELLFQIASQSDPAWIELTLLKGLGLVPEGQTKVFFVQEK